MLIFGCDYHSGFQHAALVDSATGVRRTAVGTPRRSRWHANWRGICTGCGATATGTDYVRNSIAAPGSSTLVRTSCSG